MNEISRRTFLISALTASGATLAARPPFRLTGMDWYLDDSLALIKEIIGPIESIVKIGYAAADTGQKLPASSWCIEFIGQIVDTNPATRPGIAPLLRAQYCDRVSRDFENERTTTIDGWVMSTTEAEVCITLTAALRKANCVS